jgi:predicted RNA-binding Zn-ribbon protein involved in translation (DUF1610 family)
MWVIHDTVTPFIIIKNRKVSTMDNEFKCPYCGRNMILGSIAGDGRGPIVWIPDSEKEKGFLDRITTEHSVLAKAKILKRTRLDSYQCLSCKKIIVDMK